VLRAAGIGYLIGQPMTIAELREFIGLPRATLVRKLDKLIARGHLRKEGTRYVPTAALIAKYDDPLLDKIVDLVCHAADALRKERENRL
jgi:DNA-binding IclR family transcriptional regulator